MSPDSKYSRFACLDCGRSYKAVETLNRHRKNHVAGVQYTCSTCNASFKRKDLLDRHSLIHDNGKPNTTRSGKACDRCSRLKTKCDGLTTTCTRCERGGHFCTYRHTTSRVRTGRSSTGTLSPAQSPRASIDEGGSPGSLSYSLSDPGDSMAQDQSWDADDNWAQGLWTSQGSPWQWPNLDASLDSNPSFDLSHPEPLHSLHSSPALWSDDLAGNISESLQPLPVPCTRIEDVFDSLRTTSWPEYSSYVPQIDPALGENFGYRVDGCSSTMESPRTYTSCSRA